MTFDLVIRGGTILDGSGGASFTSDLGIKDGLITKIGRITDPRPPSLDADGLSVAPGFIDGHTHMDAQVFWDDIGSSSCWHGVTTVVMGNCGFTLAPAPPQRDLVVRNIERAEDISADAIAAGIDWSWNSFSEYLDAVDRTPKGINYAANIGHSALRVYAMGERAFTDLADDTDMEKMSSELSDALQAGAIGFSTSRSTQHQTPDNQPVASRSAAWDEIRRLVAVMGRSGSGVFQLVQDLANGTLGEDQDRQLLELALETGVTVAVPAPASDLKRLRFLDEAALAGAKIKGLAHCRGSGSISSFLSHLPFDALPEWSQFRRLPFEDQLRSLADPSVRQTLVRSAHESSYPTAVGAEARKPDYERLFVMDRRLPPYRSVADLARERNLDPVDLMIDLALATGLRQLFIQNFYPFNKVATREVLVHPQTVMAFSDAGAHVSQISDSSMQTHLLGYWVRQESELALEQAIEMMTSRPASIWGLGDRGRLVEGFAADVNLFDPRSVEPNLPELVNDLPGGGQRFVQTAAGIEATIVNGKIVHQRGAHTGELPGVLIRRPPATRQ